MQHHSFQASFFHLESRVLPDWPKKGINFIDITTVLRDSKSFRAVTDALVEHFAKSRVDLVVGIEARGFIIGAPVACNLNAGFVPARKKGKLPADKVAMEYTLEYNTELLEMHSDSILPGQRVAIIDDLLATGGTAVATAKLVEQMGGIVIGFGFLVELDFLNGRKKLENYDVVSLVHFEN
ncbi:MAG: adenine phosphoribosyltransferase [Thaumarchaeota archaeon]|nr:adenine phosphoribosyltransferase [Nitrososphaerota archaeon]